MGRCAVLFARLLSTTFSSTWLSLSHASCGSSGRDWVQAAKVSLDEVLATLQEKRWLSGKAPNVVRILLCVVDQCDIYINPPETYIYDNASVHAGIWKVFTRR